MNTVTGTTNLPLNPVRTSRYESIDLGDNPVKREVDRGWRAFSRRKKDPRNVLFYSSSYRRDRAKQRQIFLKTYTLASMESSAEAKPKSQKLQKVVAVKVKKAVVSVVSFIRTGSTSMWSCQSRSAVPQSSPTPIRSCFKC